MRQIKPIQTRCDGILWDVVTLTTEGGVIETRVRHEEAEQAKTVIANLASTAMSTMSININGMMPQTPAQAPASVVETVSVADQLLKLKGLLDAGILSKAEFDAKRADLVARL